MFNSIRNAIANAIAPNRPALMIVADNVKTLSSPNAPAHALNQAERASVNQPLVGHFNVSDV